jgi:uncharacterized protein (TIGR03083 family)
VIWHARPVHHSEYCDALEHEAERFVTVAGGAGPSTPIPTCPEWTMSDLAGHVGLLYRWSSHLVRTRAPARVPAGEVAQRPDDGVVEWMHEGVTPMLTTFRTTDPDARVWGWGADRHARFWPRRMLFETVIHRADAELARGISPEIDAEVATDGMDELLANFAHAGYFAPGLADLRGSGESITFAAVDVDDAWRIRLFEGGYVWDWARVPGTASIRGRVADLLLLVYNRLPLDGGDRFAVDGDAGLAQRTIRSLSL